MNFLPLENIRFDTHFSEKEVKRIISNSVAHYGGLNTRSFYDYEGIINDNGFMICRIPKSGTNSFIPTAIGVISENADGSSIDLKIRLHNTVYIFFSVVTVFAAFLLIIESTLKQAIFIK